MIIKNSFEEFYISASSKKIIAFGASDFLRLISLNYKDLKLDRYIECVVDNDINKQGNSITINGHRKQITSPKNILEFNEEEIAIIITSDVYVYEIYEQLEAMLGQKHVDIFALSLMIAKHIDDVTEDIFLINSNEGDRIPKIIHYFWFSGEKKPELVEKCIESWKRVCPDYELKEWNGNNYDVTANPFAYQAYNQRKWAFVSDYARLDVVYKYGGIYLDLDVILHKNLDILLKHKFFVGFGPLRDIEAAAFGAIKGCSIVNEMLQIYKRREFNQNNNITLLDVQPVLLDRFFEKKGFEINGRYQEKEGITIYPRDLFSGKNWFTGEYEMTKNTLGIHECSGGWVDKNGNNTKKIKIEGNKKFEDLYKRQKLV